MEKAMNMSERSPLSLIITIGIGVALVAFLSYTILKRHKEHSTLLSRQEKHERQFTHLKKRNHWLRKEKAALLSDPVRIEKEARSQLGYTRPEEIPYKKYKFNIKE
jgi:cell division protein FtsB